VDETPHSALTRISHRQIVDLVESGRMN